MRETRGKVAQTDWLTARAPRNLIDRLDAYCDGDHDRDRSKVIRRAIREFLDRNESKGAA